MSGTATMFCGTYNILLTTDRYRYLDLRGDLLVAGNITLAVLVFTSGTDSMALARLKLGRPGTMICIGVRIYPRNFVFLVSVLFDRIIC